MSMHFTDIADHALADGVIGADEILALRRASWANGHIEPEEAETIFRINGGLAEPSAEWADYFIEAISEFIVNTRQPRGYLSEDQARWLIDKIEHDGRIESLTELELLVRVFEKSVDVHESLRVYAMQQIEQAILTGEGPTRCGGKLEKGKVNAAEARILRRIMFSSGAERPAGISRREAELLFRIKDKTLEADNAPEWKQLFVQAVGNHLQGLTGYTPVSRERALQLEAMMNDRTSSVSAFMGRMVRSVGSDTPVRRVFGRRPVGSTVQQLVAQVRQATHEEQGWLDGQIAANGQLDEYDRALLDFLAQA